MKLMLIFLPIPLPAYVFGILYLLYSIYGMNKNLGNIGHIAHFGGAISGLFVTLVIYPQIINQNLWIIILAFKKKHNGLKNGWVIKDHHLHLDW